MIAAALLAALLVAAPVAPARGDSDAATVYVTGSFRYVWDQPAAVSPWLAAHGVESWQLRPKDAVEVRLGGTCTVHGVTHKSTPTQTAICSGDIGAAVVRTVAFVAPARGDSNVPLVHVVGWHKLGPGSPDYPAHWEYAPAEQDWAFTIAAGEWVEVRARGRCTVDGQPTVRASLFRHGTCYGSGHYGSGG